MEPSGLDWLQAPAITIPVGLVLFAWIYWGTDVPARWKGSRLTLALAAGVVPPASFFLFPALGQAFRGDLLGLAVFIGCVGTLAASLYLRFHLYAEEDADPDAAPPDGLWGRLERLWFSGRRHS